MIVFQFISTYFPFYQTIIHLISTYLDDLEEFLGILEVQDSKFSPTMVA